MDGQQQHYNNNVMSRIKWDGTVSIGNLLILAGMIASVFFAWSSVTSKLQVTEDLRAKYMPQIDSVIKQSDLDKERLDRMADALVELRKSSADTNIQFQKTLTDITSDSRKTTDSMIEKINQISVDVAEIKAGLIAQNGMYKDQLRQYRQPDAKQ